MKTRNTKITAYKGPTGKEIGNEEKLNHLGVTTNEKLEFTDHI